jgi:hypothetical protein
MREGVVVLLGVVGPLAAVLSGCPSLDGFAGDGGAQDGDAGLPANGYVSLDEAVKFCSKALTCPNLGKSTLTSLHVPIDSNNFSACVSWLAGTVPSDLPGVSLTAKALTCAADAQSCSTAGSCMWFEYVSANDPRCVGFTGGQNGACSPNLTSTYQCMFGFIAHCDNPFNYTGSTCLQSQAGPYFCAVSSGLCSSPDAGSPPPCDGNFYTYCQGGLLVGFDCSVQGMTCGASGCLTNGTHKTCSGFGSVSCSGAKVEVCDGLLQSEVNCDTLGGTCDASGAVPRCTTPTDACSPYDANANSCSGNVISLCVGGQSLQYDCSSVGMQCVAGSGNVSSHCQ